MLSDARDLDLPEKKALLESRIVRLANVDDLVQYPLPDMPIYVHLDADVIDPGEAPAVNYRAPIGPSAERLQEVFRYLASTENVRAVSMSTWNPDLEGAGRTRDVCMRTLEVLLGEKLGEKL